MAAVIFFALLLYFFAAIRAQQNMNYTSEAGLFILPTNIRVELEPQLRTIDSIWPKDSAAKSDRRQALLALVKSPLIAEATFSRLQDHLPTSLDEPADLLPNVEGSVGGEVLLIRTTFGEPILAMDVANAWAEAYEAEANAIFGGSVTPINLDAEVQEALLVYEEAESRYVQILATSSLLELQHGLADRTVLLDQIRSGRLDNLNMARLRFSNLERVLVDAHSLRDRLPSMRKPDLSVYLAYLLLQNMALVQEGVITSLKLEPNQLTPLFEDMSTAELTELVDELIVLLENKQVTFAQIISEQMAYDTDTTPDDATITELEDEIRTFKANIEVENERLNRLSLERNAAKSTHTVLLNKLQEIQIASSIGEGSIVRFAFPATPEALRNSMQESLSLMGLVMVTILGLLTALGVVTGLEFMDDKVRTTRQVEQVLGISPLAVFPRSSPTMQGAPVVLSAPMAPFAEGARYLRTRLRSLHPEVHTLLITSASPHEGKSSVASNLAATLAVGGQRVILVDADLRSPVLHQLFGLINRTGLTTWLEGEYDSLDAFLQDTAAPDLKVLPAGPSTDKPAELLDSPRMETLLHYLRNVADIVIIDSPHIFGVTDALVLAKQVDGALLVLRSGRGNATQAKAAQQQIEEVGGRVIGVTLNAVPIRIQTSRNAGADASDLRTERAVGSGDERSV